MQISGVKRRLQLLHIEVNHSWSMGAINIYTRQVANHMVTVVGEAPAVSVQRIADAVEYRRPQQ